MTSSEAGYNWFTEYLPSDKGEFTIIRTKIVSECNDVLQEYALAPWSVLEQYRIEGILRYDHFSITYRASSIKSDQLVTIKEFLPRDLVVRKSDDEIVAKFPSDQNAFQKGLRYFIEEAEALAGFSHPNIVRVLKCLKANGTAYMIMSHEDGETLRKQLDRMGSDNTMPEDRIRLWLKDILDGLKNIHEKGIHHGDIGPDTIFLKKDGSAMLIDFGAVRYALNSESHNENAASTSGCSSYSSDDLYADKGGGGGLWTDIYQLGAVIYECVTGHKPSRAQVRTQASANDGPDPILEPLKQAAGRGYSENFLDTIVLAMSANVVDRRSAIEKFEKLKLASDEPGPVEEKKKEEILDEGVGISVPEKAPAEKVPLDIKTTAEAPEIKEKEVEEKTDVPEHIRIDDKEKLQRKDKRWSLSKVGLTAILVMGILASVCLVFLRPVLKIASEPGSSAVFMDENHVGETPLSIRMWMGGKHIIRVTKKGYHDFEQIVEMQFGTTKEINVELTPKLFGELTVISDPGGADVYLDGQMKGVTPLRLDKLKKGNIKLEIKKEHYGTVKRDLVVNPLLGEIKIDVHLKSLCNLSVNSTPDGATVFVDGKEKGVTPLRLENIEKGLHTVKLTKNCFSVAEKKVDITASEKTKVDVRLESVCGSLSVNSTPDGATVFVDGKEKGVTPLRLDNVMKGNISVKLTKKGFETENKVITIRPSKKFEFFVKLRQPVFSSDGRFIDHRDGTITDTETGLMWTREDSYVHLGRYLNWEQSKSYVDELNTGGYTDWRLPTAAELKKIYEIKKSNTDKDGDIIHIDSVFSPGGTFWYWSSEEQGKCCAKVVLFIDGSIIKNDRMFSYERGVRAVRP